MNTALALATFLTTTLFVMAVYFAITDLASRRRQRTSGDRSNTDAFQQLDLDANLEMVANSPQRNNKPIPKAEQFSLWVEQSGLRLNPLMLTLISGTMGIVAATIVILFLFNVWLALVAFLVITPLPFAVVAFERYRRTDKLRSQLPDALDLMSRMLRAGQTIPQSLVGVADEFESPIADEFGYCYEQQNLGLSTEVAMYEMAKRTGVLELRILVVALTIHRQTGGNLSELLDNLAKVIRERYRIQGQIRSLTADGRMQAAILLALPPLLLVVLSFLNAEYVTILYQFPWLLIGMFGFEIFGALWLHRIVSFDF